MLEKLGIHDDENRTEWMTLQVGFSGLADSQPQYFTEDCKGQLMRA